MLLKMNTATYSYEQVVALSGMNSEKLNPLFASLLQKTFVGIKETKNR